jgi:hypothetical protein
MVIILDSGFVFVFAVTEIGGGDELLGVVEPTLDIGPFFEGLRCKLSFGCDCCCDCCC